MFIVKTQCKSAYAHANARYARADLDPDWDTYLVVGTTDARTRSVAALRAIYIV